MPRRDPDEWFWHLGQELQRLSEEMVRVRPGIAHGACWEPKVDVLEDASRILIKAEIAGVRGEDIQLLYIPERHSVVLRGVRNEDRQQESEGLGVHQLEIYYGEFQREVRLPDVPIQADAIRAQYKNGFLLVMVPKGERVVVTRTITIKKV